MMFSEYVALDDSRFCDLRNISLSGRQNGVAVVYLAVLGEEAD
jgi:hypothetical protein